MKRTVINSLPIILFFIIFGCMKSDEPKDGNYWAGLSKSEKIEICSSYINERTGKDKEAKLVDQSSEYFSRRITFYYENNPLEIPVSKAMESVWSEVNKFMETNTLKREEKKNGIEENYPTGIGTIKLGDSAQMVYEKIAKSELFSFCFWGGNTKRWDDPKFEDWFSEKHYIVYSSYNLDTRSAKINLFDKEYKIYFEFNEKDCLYKINMKTTVFPWDIMYNSKIVKAYTSKYGEPYFINSDAVSNNTFHNPYIAKWKFKANISLEMYVTRPDDESLWEEKYDFDLSIVISDIAEVERIKAIEKKERKMNKSKELI